VRTRRTPYHELPGLDVVYLEDSYVLNAVQTLFRLKMRQKEKELGDAQQHEADMISRVFFAGAGGYA
jgi:hypothetical protein